jgi:hypothetical protein
METSIERQSGYEPPYDSPLEEQLALFLPKHIEDESRFFKQYQVETPRGTFKLDFLVDSPKGKFGFECDGKDFHDYCRDLFRDALILGSSDIISIHRITGKDIHNRLEDAIFAISKVEPDAFSERGRKNLWTLSTSRSNLEVVEATDDGVFASDNTRFLTMIIGRLSKKSKDSFWKKLFEFAVANQYLTTEELIEKAHQEHVA